MSLLLAATLFLQEKSADEMFRAISGKIDQARTLTIKASVETMSRGDGRSATHSSWALLVKDENKVRLTLKSGDNETVFVSDGKTLRATCPSMASSKEAPWNLVPLLKD